VDATETMSLIHIKIFGQSLDDSLVFKVIIGVICLVILVALLGSTQFNDWVFKSFIIQTAVILLIIPLTYGFIEETWTWIHIIMIIIGISLVIIYIILGNFDARLTTVSTLESIIWATIFSIIFEQVRTKLDTR
jgi:hypothetical protein